MCAAAAAPDELHWQAERRLLAALCQPGLDGDARSSLLDRLQRHTFADPDHQVIFRALTLISTREPAEVPSALAQAVTRLGFPDVDLEAFLAITAPAPQEIPDLLKQL